MSSTATMYGLRLRLHDPSIAGPQITAVYDRCSRKVSDLALYHDRASALLAAADINTREEMDRVVVVRLTVTIQEHSHA
jgi:hypothetical protein